MQSFTYDAADRLTSAAASGGTGGNVGLESYSYQAETGVLSSKGGQALSYTAQVSCPEGSRSLPHAASAMGANTYSYDCSGNMTQRVIGGSTYNLAYDAENRLSTVSGAASATYVYDGDGVRVKSAAGGATTVTIGSYFEWTGSSSTMKRYYEAGGSRIGMRQGSTLYWLVSDHLGSTSVTANASGGLYGRLLYKAWGEQRWSSGTTPTTYRYTGQRRESNINLYWYGSRWYDDALGRFIQPDTLCQIGLSGSGNSLALTVSYSEIDTLEQYNTINQIPNGIAYTAQAPQHPQNLDRYHYAANNPLKYVDDTGHCFGFAGGADTAVCTALAFAGPPGWIVDGLIIVAGVIIVGGVTYLAADYYADQQPYFSRGDGGAASSAQHLAMLLGFSVAGFAPHPGMPDPEGRDRKHNAEGLRNDLRNILRNRKSGETLERYLSRQKGWDLDMVKEYLKQLRYYIKHDLPIEKNFNPKLIEEILNLAGELGV